MELQSNSFVLLHAAHLELKFLITELNINQV